MAIHMLVMGHTYLEEIFQNWEVGSKTNVDQELTVLLGHTKRPVIYKDMAWRRIIFSFHI